MSRGRLREILWRWAEWGLVMGGMGKEGVHGKIVEKPVGAERA